MKVDRLTCRQTGGRGLPRTGLCRNCRPRLLLTSRRHRSVVRLPNTPPTRTKAALVEVGSTVAAWSKTTGERLKVAVDVDEGKY